MASIQIRYFAQLKELAGQAEETFAIDDSSTPAQVFQKLAERHHFPHSLADLRVAINHNFGETDQPLRDGDTLAFIPPVSGG